MDKFIAICRSETLYFFERIAENGRRVIYSDVVHAIASPLTDIFIGAFIWRITGSLLPVLLYKFGEWILLPGVFYLNGYFLKKFNVQKTFGIGSILAGLSPLALVFFGTTNYLSIFVYGCVHGIGNGFYYANRNYLEFKETVAVVRKYFFSMISAISGVVGIVIPVLAGWFIFFGEESDLYSAKVAYWVLFGVAFSLLMWCGTIVWRGRFEYLPIHTLKLQTPRFWTKRRILFFSHGFIDGVGFIASLLLLYLFGNEGALGIALSVTAAIVVIAIYVYGRFAKPEYERRVLFWSAILFLTASIALAVAPYAVGIFTYVLVMSIAFKFTLTIMHPIGFTLAERETEGVKNALYAFIADNEVFLNIGRLLGGLIIAALFIFKSQHAALFYGPLFLAVLHVISMGIFFKRENVRDSLGNAVK